MSQVPPKPREAIPEWIKQVGGIGLNSHPDYAWARKGQVPIQTAVRSLLLKPDFENRVDKFLKTDFGPEDDQAAMHLADYYEAALQQQLKTKPGQRTQALLDKIAEIRGILSGTVSKKRNEKSSAYYGSAKQQADIKQNQYDSMNPMEKFMRLTAAGTVEDRIGGAAGALAALGVPGMDTAANALTADSLVPDDLSLGANMVRSGSGMVLDFLSGGLAGFSATAGKQGIIAGLRAPFNMAAREAVSEAGNSYNSIRQQGGTHEKARKAAAVVFVADLVAGTLLNRFGELAPDRTVIQRILTGAPSEAVEEAQQQAAQNMAEGRPWDDGIEQAMLLGGLMGGGMAGAVHIPQGLAKYADVIEGKRNATARDKAGFEQAVKTLLQKPPVVHKVSGSKEIVRSPLKGAGPMGGEVVSEGPVQSQRTEPGQYLPVVRPEQLLSTETLGPGAVGSPGAFGIPVQDEHAPVASKPPPAAKVVGPAREVGVPNVQQRYAVRPVLMEAADVQPSHFPDGKRNPGWQLGAVLDTGATEGGAVQGRDREAAQNVARVDARAKNLDLFALLQPHLTVTEGGPYVLSTGEVVQGNGRMASIQKAISDYQTQYEKYRAALEEQYPAAKDMLEPVLVNMLQGSLSVQDIQTIGKLGNTTVTEKMNEAEQAFADSESVPPKLGSRLDTGGKSLVSALEQKRHAGLSSEWLGSLPESERASLQESDGSLNAAGRKRFANAIIAAAAGPEARATLSNQWVDNEGPGARIVEGIGYAANDLLHLRDQANQEGMDGDIAREYQRVLGEAIKELESAKAQGFSGERLVDYFDNGKMLADVDPIVLKLGKTLAQNRDSGVRIGEVLSSTAKAVTDAGGGLFGEELKFDTAQQAIEAALAPYVAETVGSVEGAQNELTKSAETKPEPSASAPEAVSSPKPATLPENLKGAKPRYAYGSKQFTLNFASDVDRAAYIAAQDKPSKQDAAYVNFAMDATGMSEQEVRDHGKQVRAAIKEMAKNGKSGATLQVEDQKGNPPAAPTTKLQEKLSAAEQELADTRAALEKARKGASNRRGGKSSGAASTLTAEISHARAWIKVQGLKGAVAFEEFWKYIKSTFGASDAERDHYATVFDHAQQEIEDENNQALATSVALQESARLGFSPADPEVVSIYDLLAEARRMGYGTKQGAAAILAKYNAGGQTTPAEIAGISVRLSDILEERMAAQDGSPEEQALIREDKALRTIRNTQEARVLAVRAILMRKNYSPAGIVGAVERAIGRPLTKLEMEKWIAVGKKIQELQAQLNEAETKMADVFKGGKRTENGSIEITPEMNEAMQGVIEAARKLKAHREAADQAIADYAMTTGEKVARIGGMLSTEIKLWNPMARAVDVTNNIQTLAIHMAQSPAEQAMANWFSGAIGADPAFKMLNPKLQQAVFTRWKAETAHEVAQVDFGAEKSGIEDTRLALPKWFLATRLAAAMDAPFRAYHFMAYAAQRAQAAAKAQGGDPVLMLDQIREPTLAMSDLFKGKGLSYEQAQQIHKEAGRFASTMVYTNENVFSEIEKGLQQLNKTKGDESMGALHHVATAALRFTFQFSRVLGNVTDKTAQYSSTYYAPARAAMQVLGWPTEKRAIRRKGGGELTLKEKMQVKEQQIARARQLSQTILRYGIGQGLRLLGFWFYNDEKERKELGMPDESGFEQYLKLPMRKSLEWFGPLIVQTYDKNGKRTGNYYQNDGTLAQIGGALGAFLNGYRSAQIEASPLDRKQKDQLQRGLLMAPLRDNPVASNALRLLNSLDKSHNPSDPWWSYLSSLYFPGGLREWAQWQDRQQGIYGRRGEGLMGNVEEKLPYTKDKLPVRGRAYYE